MVNINKMAETIRTTAEVLSVLKHYCNTVDNTSETDSIGAVIELIFKLNDNMYAELINEDYFST